MKKIVVAIIFAALCFLCSCGAASDMSSDYEDAAILPPTQSAATSAAEGETSAAFGQTALPESTYPDEYEVEDINHGLHYFTFAQNSTDYKNDDELTLLVETLTQTEFYADDQNLMEWVYTILDNIHADNVAYSQSLLNYASGDLEAVGEGQFYSFSHHVSMDVGRHDDDIISLLELSTVYSGGSTPSSVRTSYNLDLDQMRVLTLEDLIEPSAAPILLQMVLSQVESTFEPLGEDALSEDYEQIITNEMEYGNMTPHWYFDEDGLVVFFNQYTLGPNTSGMIKIPLSYEKLDGILHPYYFPDEYSGAFQGISVLENPGGGDQMYSVNFGEGEPVYIEINGNVHHVQFSEVLWVDQTSVGENMIFSANQLKNSSVLRIRGDLEYTEKVYALEYYDEVGGPYVWYIQGTNILEELPANE